MGAAERGVISTRYTDFALLTPNANADGEFGLISFGGQQGGGDSGYAKVDEERFFRSHPGRDVFFYHLITRQLEGKLINR
jgi:hypothetical protein